MSGDPPLIFLIAGEPSGDALGGRLMMALRRLTGGRVQFAGIGGEQMTAAGLEPLFPIAELALMGLVEVLPRLPRLRRRVNETVRAIQALSPDAVVTIDSPGFCSRVWRGLRGAGIPLIHYVAPSVWAWRPGRARKLARAVDHLVTLLPFEPPYFEREGLTARFAGHPAIEEIVDPAAVSAFRAGVGIAAEAPLLCVLPGSRMGEAKRLLPPFGAAVGLLARRIEGLSVVVPTVPTVSEAVRQAVSEWTVPTVVVEAPAARRLAMAAADVALAASGTVALELALAGTPAVVAYRVHPITYQLVRRMVRVEYVSLTNLILARGIVPELLQDACRPDRLADEIERLLNDPAARAAQIAAGRQVAELLGAGDRPPSERAAAEVLAVIAERQARLEAAQQGR